MRSDKVFGVFRPRLSLPTEAGKSPVPTKARIQAGCCRRTRAEPLAGMPRAEDLFLSARWCRNMGFPRASAAGGRREAPRKMAQGGFPPLLASLCAGKEAGGEAARWHPLGSARRCDARRAPPPEAAAGGGVFEKRICAVSNARFPPEAVEGLCVRSEPLAGMPQAEDLSVVMRTRAGCGLQRRPGAAGGGLDQKSHACC